MKCTIYFRVKFHLISSNIFKLTAISQISAGGVYWLNTHARGRGHLFESRSLFTIKNAKIPEKGALI